MSKIKLTAIAPATLHHHPHLRRLRLYLRGGRVGQRLHHSRHPEEQVHAHAHKRLPRQPGHL